MPKTRHSPTPSDALTQAIGYAVELHRRGLLDDARNLYEGVLRLQPRHFDALHLLGVLNQQRGNDDEALRLIEAALRLKPNAPDALANFGLVLQRTGRSAEALSAYERALAAQPGHASALNNRGHLLTGLGRYAEALASLDAATTTDPNHVEAWNNRGTVLRKLNRHTEALASYDRALAIAPDHLESINNRGNALLEMGRPADALAAYDAALAITPDFAEGHNNRGNALAALERIEEALASYERTLALVPNHATALYNRGNALLKLDRPQEAVESFDRALALVPAHKEAWNNRGLALQALNRLDEALASYAQARAASPFYADAHYNEGLARLCAGDLARGFEQYEWRWRRTEFAGYGRALNAPLWLGDAPLAGQTLLVHAEQGLGDTIQFVRYLPQLAEQGANVILEVQPPLKPLLAGIASARSVIARGEPLPHFDQHCPLMSLPLACGTTLATVPASVPYIAAPVERSARWRERLPGRDRLRVGLAWSGRAAHKNDRNRSVTLARLEPLLSIGGIQFVSLQQELRGEDEAILSHHPGLLHFGAQLEDFADTAALIGEMDLVVSVDTSVAHLAGAMAKPLWLMLPFAPDFRWLLDRRDNPWYPTARLFRQQRLGDWGGVIADVGHELEAAATPGEARKPA